MFICFAFRQRDGSWRLASPAGFTLVELLVVVAVIAVLAALGLPALASFFESGRRVQCQSRLANLGRGILLYAQDQELRLPSAPASRMTWNPLISSAYTYAGDILPYIGLSREKAVTDRNTFRCPSRKYEPLSGSFQRSHYAFNGANEMGGPLQWPKGLAGLRLHAIHEPSRTVLIAEAAVATPFSNHPFKGMTRKPDSKSWLFFVDGHTAFLPIHDPGGPSTLMKDPPASYGYKWSADPVPGS